MSTSSARPGVSERALARLGTTVQQKYRITQVIGIGGTAAVYAATHLNGHRVAIKFLLDRYLDDADMRRLFSREAYVANQVGHPGAVPVLDNDIDEGGCPFLIMPLLEGQTLRARWERAERRLPLAEVGVLMADVLDVLDSAHSKGIVHRDIKPENLFLTSTGDIRVLDFGIARRVHPDGSASVTVGLGVGTPGFMPPEQAIGDRRAVGPRSDCWAIGATMFTLLSGEFVHVADNASAQFVAAATNRARSLRSVRPELPPAIVEFVDKSLAFEPKDRWHTARQMREALLDALAEALGESAANIASHVRAGLVVEFADASGAPTEPPAVSLWQMANLVGDRELTRTKTPPAGHGLQAADLPLVPIGDDSRKTTSTLTRTAPPEVVSTRKSRTPLGNRGRLVAIAVVAVASLGAMSMLGRRRDVPSTNPAAVNGPLPECTTNAACVRGHEGRNFICRKTDGTCRSLDAPGCTVLADEGDVENDATIWFGAMFPMSEEPADLFGKESVRAIDLAAATSSELREAFLQ